MKRALLLVLTSKEFRMTIEISANAKISSLADIEDSVRGSQILIGEGTIIDSFVKIKPAGGLGNLTIGRNCVINSGCVLYTGNGIIVGDNVAVAANCTFAPVNHAYEQKSTLVREQGFKTSKGGIVIEDDVWIGAGCVLLDGSIIKRGCVIGAMSLVRGELESYGVYVGNPLLKVAERK